MFRGILPPLAETDEWRWTDDQGVQRVVRADELRSALASNVLAPSTLVWREGMSAWAPASTIPELGVSDDRPVTAPANEGTTDIGIPAAVRLGDGPTDAEESRHPTLTKRTDRPTPTELLTDPSRGAGAANEGRAPRPAAGQPAAGPLKINAAPKPLISVPRAAARLDSTPKPAAQRPGAWSAGASGAKASMAKTKSDDELTLVADARDPFKLKAPGEPAAGAASTTPSPTAAGTDAAKAAGRAGARRPLTHTAIVPDQEAPIRPAPRPLPAAGAPARRSTVPPAPLPMGRRSPSNAPERPVPSAGAKGSEPPPAAGDQGAPERAGYGAMPASTESALGKPGFAIPKAARVPSVGRSGFEITENTSTGSTGVLPLSGKYAAEPAVVAAFAQVAAAHAERVAAAEEAAGAPAKQSAQAPYVAVPQQPIDVAPAPPAEAQAPQGAGDAGLASYPPVPHLVLAAHRALAGRAEPAPAASPFGLGSQTVPIAGPGAAAPAASASAPPGGYSPAPPYSAPAPTLALVEPPAPTEMRVTGALPLVHPKHPQSMPPPASAESAPSSDVSDDALPRSSAKVGDAVIVPMSSLFGSGAILIAMAVGAFFVGRCSMAHAPSAAPARAAFAVLPRLARAGLPSPPKPCWMAKQPVRWAPTVLQTVPVDVAPLPNGVVAAYARDENEPATVEVDFTSGAFTDKGADKRPDRILRVFAPHSGSAPFATTDGDKGPLAPFVYAPAAKAFVLGVTGRGSASPAVAAADKPDGTPVTLWPLSAVEKDKGLEAARVLASGPSTFAVVFRRSGSILGGYFTEGLKAEGGLGTVAGSGGTVGKPSLGATKREVAVVFADQAKSDAPWEIRAGHAPLGQMPKETIVVPLPKGGPGGDAFAPDIAGTADGRWVLVWTEGRSSAYAVRAQTFGPDFKALGDPIAISPPAGNFGQAIVGVSGNYVTTMFLSKPKDAKSYELWGAVLQCGP